MKKLILLMLITINGWGTSITVTLLQPSQVAVSKDAFVRFELKNYGDFVPRVIGTNVILSSISDFTPDSFGIVSGNIQGNDTISPVNTYYSVGFFKGGVRFYTCDMIISGTTQDLDNTSCLITGTPPVPFKQCIQCNGGGGEKATSCGPGQFMTGEDSSGNAICSTPGARLYRNDSAGTINNRIAEYAVVGNPGFGSLTVRNLTVGNATGVAGKIVGIVNSGAGTSGFALVTYNGLEQCTFRDAPTTIGASVVAALNPSEAADGKCEQQTAANTLMQWAAANEITIGTVQSLTPDGNGNYSVYVMNAGYLANDPAFDPGTSIVSLFNSITYGSNLPTPSYMWQDLNTTGHPIVIGTPSWLYLSNGNFGTDFVQQGTGHADLAIRAVGPGHALNNTGSTSSGFEFQATYHSLPYIVDLSSSGNVQWWENASNYITGTLTRDIINFGPARNSAGTFFVTKICQDGVGGHGLAWGGGGIFVNALNAPGMPGTHDECQVIFWVDLDGQNIVALSHFEY